MMDNGLLSPGIRVLDIGCSNLYDAGKTDITNFMRRLGVEDEAFASRIASESAKKTAFAGELLDRCGIDYNAIDFAVDYKTTKFDLNHDELRDDFKGSFDLVINFGTTEHVLNQAHAFKVIHNAAKPGGHIYHHLVAGGFFGHGYFLYSGRFAFDLAGYNGYQIKTFSIEQDDQTPKSDITSTMRDYSTYFPALKNAPPISEPLMRDTFIAVGYRKVHDSSFKFPQDTSGLGLSTSTERSSLRQYVGKWLRKF